MFTTASPAGLPSGSWFERIVESAPDAILVADPRGCIALINRSAELLFGYSRAELVGQAVEVLTPLRFRAQHPAHVAGFLKAPKMRAMGAGRELFGLRKNGTEVPIEIGLNPIDTPDGQFTLASIIDITERKRAEERFRLVVEAAPNAMVMADRERHITLVNRSAETLFGYTRSEMIGQPLEALLPLRFRPTHPTHVAEFLSAPKMRAMGAGRELFALRKNGAEVPVEIGLNPIDTPTGLFILASIIDITERRLHEDRLRRNHAELEKVNQELDEFAYTASHDLRAPLTGVSTVAQWILDDDLTLAPQSRERLALIQNRMRRMSSLLTDIHEFARAGRTAECTGPMMPAAALVAEVATTLQAPAAFAIVADASLAACPVTRMPLAQVFHNLIGNAIKHHDRAGGTIRVTVEPREGWLRFTVEDDGPGIPAAYREAVFEMFKTLKPRDQVEGSGMGLALVRKIVTRLGGSCGIATTDQRGTRLWFDWPATVPATRGTS